KPSTLHDYRWSLSESGRVISALGDTPAREITAADIETLLDSIEAAGLSARTINKTRNLIGAVFAYGVRKHGLHANPARATDKRRSCRRRGKRSTGYGSAATSLAATSSASRTGAAGH